MQRTPRKAGWDKENARSGMIGICKASSVNSGGSPASSADSAHSEGLWAGSGTWRAQMSQPQRSRMLVTTKRRASIECAVLQRSASSANSSWQCRLSLMVSRAEPPIQASSQLAESGLPLIGKRRRPKTSRIVLIAPGRPRQGVRFAAALELCPARGITGSRGIAAS